MYQQSQIKANVQSVGFMILWTLSGLLWAPGSHLHGHVLPGERKRADA